MFGGLALEIESGYLTDFRPDGPSEDRLIEVLQGCDTIICENHFRNQGLELAKRSFHMVSLDVARLARRTGAKKLILFHLSDRYTRAEWQEQLAEVRAMFQEAYFPESWEIGAFNCRVKMMFRMSFNPFLSKLFFALP
jgi:ribonuclease BN (tRNA processing enzyme)